MRADRLLSALLLLQAQGKLSTRALAARLEVSERTAYRDMEALSAAGVPVFALRGSRGGWQLDENWRTRVPGLDDAELRALLMAQPRVMGDPRLVASAERALTKLTAALPAPLRERAVSIRQRLLVDTTGWYGYEEDVSALPIVQDAVANDRMLAIRYRPPRREAEDREVGPLGLVAKGTTWYLVAQAPGGVRTYRVSRMERAVILDTRFERPAGFDLATYWKSAAEQFRSTRRYVATLRMESGAAASVRTWCRVLPGAHAEKDGRVTLRVDFDDEGHACFVVLGLGRRAEAIEPAPLRERVAAEVAAMAERSSRIHEPREPRP